MLLTVHLAEIHVTLLQYLSQGANSAVEDGTILGLLIGKIQSRYQLPKALGIHEKLRKMRGDAIAKDAFK